MWLTTDVTAGQLATIVLPPNMKRGNQIKFQKQMLHKIQFYSRCADEAGTAAAEVGAAHDVPDLWLDSVAYGIWNAKMANENVRCNI